MELVYSHGYSEAPEEKDLYFHYPGLVPMLQPEGGSSEFAFKKPMLCIKVERWRRLTGSPPSGTLQDVQKSLGGVRGP